MAEHIIVEAVCGQIFAARVAAPSLRVALSLDALFRFALEAFRRPLNAARGAGMALYATQGPDV